MEKHHKSESLFERSLCTIRNSISGPSNLDAFSVGLQTFARFLGIVSRE